MSINNYAMFDDSRVVYDLLRFPSALVLKQSVREIISPAMLFAHNYISSDSECLVRMTQLHLNPWLGMYVSPDNAIVLDENFPLIPADLTDDWRTPKFDNTRISYSSENGQAVLDTSAPAQPMPDLSHEIQPINANSIIIPGNNMAILNFNDTPDRLTVQEAEVKEELDNFCMRDVKLSVAMNSLSDFMMNNNGVNLGPPPSQVDQKPPTLSAAENVNASRPNARDDFMDFLRRF